MINSTPKYKPDVKLWQTVATASGVFTAVVCLLIIVNYIQINRVDPVETAAIEALVNRLSQNPEDEQLREQIRTLDLLARKAYFTNQWQIRAGGYLLLMGVVMVIISFQMLMAAQKKIVHLEPESKTDLIFLQKKTRLWVSGFSIVLVAVTLIFATFTYRRMGNRLQNSLNELRVNEIADSIENINRAVAEVLDDKTEIQPDTIVAEQPVIENEIEAKTLEVENDKITEKHKADISGQVREEIKNTLKKEMPETADTHNQAFSSMAPGFEYSVPYPEEYARNYPAFRGPGGNGIAFQENLPDYWNGETGENILWKTEIPLPGFNSPIVWNNHLFVTGGNKNEKAVFCYHTETGELLWTGKVENVPGATAQPSDIPDYTGYAASTAATDGKFVFAIFPNSDVATFDFDGKLIWARNLGPIDNHYGYSSSLLTYNGKLIIQWDQRNVATVMALETETGITLWETNRDVKISWASPVIISTISGPQLVLAADPFVVAYNPDNGEEIWKLRCLSGEVGPSVAGNKNMVFALNEYASLVGIRLDDTPEVAWEDFDYLSDVPSPVATDDYLIVTTSYGVFACYDTQSGDKLWEAEIDNSVYSSPVIADGKVYMTDKQGITHIFRADKEYVSLGQAPLGEGSVCTPAFANGRIFIRGEKHLFCIGE
jgi:outer membrane protein assembly factor BamB